MRTTIERTIDAKGLPIEVRGNIADGTIVRVLVEVLTDENGFTPERAAALDEAIEESLDPKNLDGSFKTADEVRAYLDNLGN